jgi:glycerophosphoryl diester phosphodiesterase
MDIVNFFSEKRRRNILSGYDLTDSAERLLCGAVDFVYARHKQPLPERSDLKNCKLISHRGEYDNRIVFENTLKAFDKVSEKGVFGIEFDVRWTKDLKPVVLHDGNTARLYNKDIFVDEVCCSDLRRAVPEIPSLEEIISRYGKKLHLMVEIKEERYPDPLKQAGILKSLFSDLEPGTDYHFISLSPRIFSIIDFAPGSAFIPIARLNMGSISQTALQNNYGGIAGHYMLVTKSLIRRHLDKGQKVGTGFVDSKYSLFRELNRGIEWIFSNNASYLQTAVNSFVGHYSQ